MTAHDLSFWRPPIPLPEPFGVAARNQVARSTGDPDTPFAAKPSRDLLYKKVRRKYQNGQV